MRVASRKYLAGSRGAPCTLRIAGVCRGETETVVPCHIRDRHTGRSIKASDISVADGCARCHDVFDRRAAMPDGSLISESDWLFYALRGLQETQERRIQIGLLFVPQDIETPYSEKPVKPRLPPEQRSKVPTGRPLQSRPQNWPKREMRSRNDFERKR